MFKTFLTIKNIGKFRDCRAAGDVEFRNLTLIYAENGRGQSTVCDILHSLQAGDAAILNGRSTLGSPNQPETAVRLDGETATFKGGAWTTTCPDLAIFDTRFVHDNVFAGDYVDHEHKRNLY
jgi:wobble nucleotide-excising tRNase